MPTVTLSYDTCYLRSTSFVDGIGTTRYSYVRIDGTNATYGDGQLASVNGPWSNNTISYTNDLLGRSIERDINGETAEVGFDALGRVSETTNTLGTFTYDHVASTGRLSSVTASTGQVTNFDDLGASHTFALADPGRDEGGEVFIGVVRRPGAELTRVGCAYPRLSLLRRVRGSVMANSAPRGSVFRAVMRPPWNSTTMLWTQLRPRPSPSPSPLVV